ncbi:MAG: hypothetical protein RL510_1223 [Actinomycetota bacterium]|jgi:Na+-driven multidrug efflux pump
MNSGPNASASIVEIILAIFFVALVFGVFLFAFATPVAAFFSTVSERWPEYPLKRKVQLISWAVGTVLVVSILLWISAMPLPEA